MRILIACVMTAALSSCATTISTALAVDSKLKCLTELDDEGIPAKPRGEFPFRITYVNHGVHGSIEDTRVCQFKERKCFGGGVWQNIWHDTYASGREKLVIPPAADGRRYIVLLKNSCDLLMDGGTLPDEVSIYLAKGTDSSVAIDRLIIKRHGDIGPEIVRVEQRDGP